MRKLTAEEKDLAISLAMQGKTLPQIRDALQLHQFDFYKMRQADPQFDADFARARAEGCDELVDSLLTVMESEPDVQRARLYSENVRWMASKRKPTVYGDRIDLNVNQTIDIGSALADARARALPTRYQSDAIEAEAREVVEALPAHSPDTSSEGVPENGDAPKSSSPSIFD